MKRLQKILLLLTTLTASTSLADSAHYVSITGSNMPPFDTWETAATNIMDAVDEAYNSGSGYPIVVTDGVYQISQPIILDFPITVRSVNGPTVTVIDAAYASPCLLMTGSAVVVEGFTLSRGSGNSGGNRVAAGTLRNCIVKQNLGYYHGGLYIEVGGLVEDCLIVSNTATHPSLNGGGGVAIWQNGTIRNSMIVSNRSLAAGGGVFSYGSGTIINCTIEANITSNSSGGGIIALQSGTVVSNCIIRGNTSKQFGGGAHCYFGGTLVGCSIISNNSGVVGGGLSLYEGGLARNCIVYGNRSSNDGAGITFTSFSNLVPTVQNCTIVSNRAATNAGGIGYNISGGTGRIYNSIIFYNVKGNGSTDNWGEDFNDIKYTMCCTTPSHGGTDNITSQPDFVNRATLDLTLLSSSPCIDSGSNLTEVVDDISGVFRPLNGDNSGKAFTDMGAHEYVHATADTDGDRMPDWWEASGGISGVESNDSVDSDTDGLFNYDEYIAGTSPSDSNSVFQFGQANMLATNDSRMVMSWSSVTGRSYSIFATTNLATPVVWLTNLYRLPGTGGTMIYTNSSGLPRQHYRLTVVKP